MKTLIIAVSLLTLGGTTTGHAMDLRTAEFTQAAHHLGEAFWLRDHCGRALNQASLMRLGVMALQGDTGAFNRHATLEYDVLSNKASTGGLRPVCQAVARSLNTLPR